MVDMSSETPSLGSKRRIDTPGLVVFALLLVAFLWRSVYFFEMYAGPYAFDLGLDGEVFHRAALEVAAGRWSSGQVFFQAPLYPFFLGAIYVVFGPNPIVAKLVQILLSVASCWLIYHLARRVFDRSKAVVALALASIYGMFLFFANELVVVTLFTFLVLAALSILIEASVRDSLLWWVGAGLAFGFAGITRGTILPLAAVVPLWLIGARRQEFGLARLVKEAALFSVGVLVVVAPVTIHNYHADGSFVLVASNDGVNFFIGNNPDSDGMTAAVVGTRGDHVGGKEDQIRIAREGLGNPRATAGEVSKFWYGEGLQFIRKDPWAAMRLAARKVLVLINAYEVGNNRVIEFTARHSRIFRWGTIGFWLILPLAVAGMILGTGRRPQVMLLYAFVSLYAAILVVFFITSRYRLPVVPVLIIFAAVAICEWVGWLRKRQWRSDRNRTVRVAISIVAALLVLVVMRPTSSIRNPDAQAFFNEAEAYRTTGNYAAAAQWYRQALIEHPGYCDAGFNLARIQGEVFADADGVVNSLEPLIASCPDDVGIRRLLGLGLCASGRCIEGIVHLELVAKALPDSEDAQSDLHRARQQIAAQVENPIPSD